MTLLLAFLLQLTTAQKLPVITAANKLMPAVTWNSDSVIIEDFTCRGRKEQAILGVVHSEAAHPYAILAVFLDGLDKQPELLRDRVHVAADVKLETESLDYDPSEEIGIPIRGFERSKTCKGLNLADDHTDSFHIYWDHVFRVFDWWSL